MFIIVTNNIINCLHKKQTWPLVKYIYKKQELLFLLLKRKKTNQKKNHKCVDQKDG